MSVGIAAIFCSFYQMCHNVQTVFHDADRCISTTSLASGLEIDPFSGTVCLSIRPKLCKYEVRQFDFHAHNGAMTMTMQTCDTERVLQKKCSPCCLQFRLFFLKNKNVMDKTREYKR